MNKHALKDALLAALDAEITAALSSASTAHATASDANNKPENKYDTLALEAAYLAHGQSERILELQQRRIQLARWPIPVIEQDEVIRLGACITLIADDDTERTVFIAPVGGHQIESHGIKILVVSPDTPLAKVLIGKSLDDEAALTLSGRKQNWRIVAID
jgi:transcription elongation GreA/GreB family factor